LAVTSWAADDFSATEEKIKEALAGEVRTEADTVRDRNRKPVATLKFFGLRDDMKVLELVPGGGWYTKVLAPVLEKDGELYLSIGAERLQGSLLKEPGFKKVKVLGADLRNPPLEFGEKNFDMVLTFRNLHNFPADGRKNINAAVFQALKKGGLYGVVDHTRRHMERDAPFNGRRVDPVLVIKELEAEGFEFVDFSNLHYRPDDELRYEVGVRSVTGNTDRFTMLFRKP
jgi:predicted methyltransferase|tara:strand:+ start:1709 stop:2395 length:687 start_codon:yes stop_codon:yes gene_type:complete